jgi:hypothetical protein
VTPLQADFHSLPQASISLIQPLIHQGVGHKSVLFSAACDLFVGNDLRFGLILPLTGLVHLCESSHKSRRGSGAPLAPEHDKHTDALDCPRAEALVSSDSFYLWRGCATSDTRLCRPSQTISAS